MKPKIVLFNHHPECSNQCCAGMITALSAYYSITTFSEQDLTPELLDDASIIAFPGGIGDADTYYNFFQRRKANLVADFIDRGGHYLGICMGAYWAGSHYFDILDGVDAVQYIKRPRADVRRSYSTVTTVQWNNMSEDMFFYDGCSLVGDETKFTTVARYSNNDPMAIIQGRVGIIGCHPESMPTWYDKDYLKPHWHGYRHHNLLLDFVNQLSKNF
jgi:glutamine amidotransferase-like uncharacterized protein